MSAWNEGDWIAVIALVVLGVFLAVGVSIAGPNDIAAAKDALAASA